MLVAKIMQSEPSTTKLSMKIGTVQVRVATVGELLGVDYVTM